MTRPTFEAYLESLTDLTTATDPTVLTAEAAELKNIGDTIARLPKVSRESLVDLMAGDPDVVPALGLAVGLSSEALKNVMRHHLGSSGYKKLAKENPFAIIVMLDDNYDLIRLIEKQRKVAYGFGDVLVARAGTRATAVRAAGRGRRIEDEIEAVASDLGLSDATRTRFAGRGGDAPCDLAIPAGGTEAKIVVAAKGFNSTGSKLTDAVREVEEMARLRLPTQFVFVAVDGIGWKSRQADLRRIYRRWEQSTIDGMYTLSTNSESICAVRPFG